MGFIKNKTYYSDVVYEWNLPTGTTCPFANGCKIVVDRFTGKFESKPDSEFRCYASKSERFPAVREHRWNNYEQSKRECITKLPDDCRFVRIHASGDFYSQQYFDLWLMVAWYNIDVKFWAYTKSIGYWVNRLNNIPNNLILTASYGGKQDEMIAEYGLKNVRVYTSIDDVPANLPIDTNDDFARIPDVCFALLDNNKYSKKAKR